MLGLDYAAWQIAAILATYLFAATAKGVTGLGFSTICLPFLTLVVGLKGALPLIIVPSLMSNVVVMRDAGRLSETLRRFWPMYLTTLPGLLLGLWALSRMDGQLAGAALGAMLLLWCLFSLVAPPISLPPKWERPIAPISGFLTGTVNGVTGAQVIPSVPFLMTLRLAPNQFIQAANCSFTLSSLVMMLGLTHLGLFTLDAAIVSAIGALAIFSGLNLGSRIRAHLSPARFRLGVLLMLMGMGISLFLQGI